METVPGELVKQVLSWGGWLVAVLVAFTKTWKAIFGSEFSTDVKKGFPMFMKWVFKDATWKTEMMNELRQIKNEVAYNGGAVTLSMAFKQLEADNRQLKRMVQHNKALRDITDLCSDKMIFRMNHEGACTFINDSFLKFFGWVESDVLDYAFEDVVHPEDVPDMRLKWQKAISTKKPFKDDQRIRDVNGVYHDCIVRAHPVVLDMELAEFSGTIDFA